MADDKVPLKTSVNGDAVDYEALFNREGDQRRHSEKFAAKTAIGVVHTQLLVLKFFTSTNYNANS